MVDTDGIGHHLVCLLHALRHACRYDRFLRVQLLGYRLLPNDYLYVLFSCEQLCKANESMQAYILPGDPVANMYGALYGQHPMIQGIALLQDLKLGQYVKLAPRVTFLMQMTGMFSRIAH